VSAVTDEESLMDIVFNISDGNRKIKIVSEVVALLCSYKQRKFYDKEAGGILVYRECIESGNIIVEYATEPYKGDFRSRTRFCRKDNKHIEVFNKLHTQHNTIYGYLGEWHTHPEKYPNCSNIDKMNWERIAAQNDDSDRKYYHVIVGIESISIWLYDTKQNSIKMVYNGVVLYK
jgi:integrative and conjugative element protein (TIGR02256 family)